MFTPLALVDGEAILPLAGARAHLNLGPDETADDALIGELRNEAINVIEYHSRQSLQARQFLWEADAFSVAMRLPMRPVQSVDEISYRDTAGLAVPLDASSWSAAGGFLSPAAGYTWPRIGTGRAAVRITFTAGYLATDFIPPALIAAVKLALSAMYDDRSNPDLMPALRLADKFRRRRV